MGGTRKLGLYNLGGDLDTQLEFARSCEEMGLDVVAFTDQIEGNVPFDLEPEGGPEAAAPDPGRWVGMLDARTVMALCADRTRSIVLFLGAIDTVRHVPSKLAQEFFTIDHVARGRALFAVGASEAKNVLPYGHRRIGSQKKLEDSLAIIRALFDSPGQPVFYQGEQYSMKGGRLVYRPYGAHPPRVIATTGGGPETLEPCGRYGDGLLTNLPGFCLGGPEQFGRDREAVRRAAERAGRDPDRLTYAASVLVMMHDDRDAIERRAATFDMRWNTIVYGATKGAEWRRFGFVCPMGDDWGYARKLVPARMTADEVRRAAMQVPVEAVTRMGHFTGTPEEVAGLLEPYFEAGLEYAFIVDYMTWSPEYRDTALTNLDRLVRALKGEGLRLPGRAAPRAG